MPIAIPFAEDDGNQVLIPTAAPDGAELNEAAAIEQYKKSGKHYGKFDTAANAKAYAAQLQKTAPDAPQDPATAELNRRELIRVQAGQPDVPPTGPTEAPAAPATAAPTAAAPAAPATGPPAAAPAGPAVTAPTTTEPTPAAPAAGLAPMQSREAMLARIPVISPLTGRPLTLEQRALAEGYVNKAYNERQQLTEESRARLLTDLTNGKQMLADGKPFDYSEAYIRSLLPPEKADPVIQELSDAKIDGAAMGKVQGMTATEIRTENDRLQAGLDTGPPTGYLRRRKEAQAFGTAVTKHIEGLKKDAPDYLLASNPRIRAAYDAATQSPQNFADYALMTLAEQARLEVPENQRAILPKGKAAQIASTIAAIDPATTKPVDEMRKLAARFGAGQGTADYWPQVMGELVKAKLPGEYQVLASMDRPDQVVAADDLSRALQLLSQKGGKAELKQAQGSILPKTVDDDLREKLKDFRLSTNLNGVGGAKLYDNMEDTVRTLTYWYRYQNKSDSQAVNDAIDGIIGRKYDFPEIDGTTVRVPKDTGSVVATAAERIRADVKPAELPPIPGQPLLSPAQRQEVWMGAIRNGGWAMNEDGSGMVLMARLREGSYVPVTRIDGSQVVLKFRDAPAYAYGDQPPPPTAVEGTVSGPRPPTGPAAPRLPGTVRSPVPTGTVLPPAPQPELR